MDALRELEKLSFEAKQKRYSHAPKYALVKSRFSDRTTNDLTQAIIECVRIHGGFISRINNVGVWDATRKIYRTSTTVKGFPDLTGVICGKPINIEVKRGRDKMSVEQLDVMQKIKSAGGFYFVARDFGTFYTWFKEEVINQK
jgi:hypothetical protein